MSEKKFDIYFEFNYSGLNLAAFSKTSGQLEYYKEQNYKSYFDNYKELNFEKLDKLLEANIFAIEKLTEEFVRDIYLIVDTPQSTSIKLSVIKNNEGNKIIKEDAMYLLQDAKQQLLKSNQDLGIIHIIVENYVLDNIQYKFFPSEKKCTKFSIDVVFICFPKDLLKSFEKLFLKQQIYITQFVCSNYIKTFDFTNKDQNICECAKDIVQGANKQEVVSIPKELKKKGFFEKLFHFFK
jgi:cell division protein FtsA